MLFFLLLNNQKDFHVVDDEMGSELFSQVFV